jgi:hypothetical protein
MTAGEGALLQDPRDTPTQTSGGCAAACAAAVRIGAAHARCERVSPGIAPIAGGTDAAATSLDSPP